MLNNFVAYCYAMLCFGVGFFLITPTYRAVYQHSKETLPPIRHLGVAWVFITTLIFLGPSIWLVYAGVLVLSFFMGKNLECRVVWYVFLLLVSPKFINTIGGGSGINVLIKLYFLQSLIIRSLLLGIGKNCKNNQPDNQQEVPI